MDATILLIADYAALDTLGKLTVVGAFNKIYVPKFPVTHPSLYVTIRFMADLGETSEKRTLKVFLVDHDYNQLWSTPEIPFQIARPQGGSVAEFTPIINIQQIEFHHPGQYAFKVQVDKEIKGTIPFDVLLMQPDAG